MNRSNMAGVALVSIGLLGLGIAQAQQAQQAPAKPPETQPQGKTSGRVVPGETPTRGAEDQSTVNPGPSTGVAEGTAADRTQPGKTPTAMKKDQGPAMPVTSQSFVTQAATTDMAEIELAQLALKNSQDAAVKKLADQMIKDHTASSAKLKSIAGKDNLTLPTGLDAAHAAVKSKLASLKGKDFDKAYSMEMAKGHDKAVALFESASQATGMTPDLKQFATSTLPTLREHKAKSHELHGKTGA